MEVSSRYVAGFAFDQVTNEVMLIEKNRPEDQKGLLNGAGGKVEASEDPQDAMARECEEETGVVVPAANWLLFHREYQVEDKEKQTLKEIRFYATMSRHLFKLSESKTDEQVKCVLLTAAGSILDACPWPMMYNLGFLVPMARTFLKHPDRVPYLR